MIIVLLFGSVLATDTLWTKNNMVYFGTCIELTQTHVVFNANDFAGSQRLPLKVVQYLSSEGGTLFYGTRPIKSEVAVFEDEETEQLSTNKLSEPAAVLESIASDQLILVNGDTLTGEFLSSNADFVQFCENSKKNINNLPIRVIHQILDAEGEVLYPKEVVQTPKEAVVQEKWDAFRLLPNHKVLLVLDGGAVKEVYFRKVYNDSLFYGLGADSAVSLGSISSLWSEGQDIEAGAVGSSCGLVCGSCLSYPLLIMSFDEGTSILPVIAVPVATAFLVGKRFVNKPSWQLVYRPQIPRNGWDYEQGYEAGKNLASAKPTWLLPGFFYNFWAVQTSRNLRPCPPASEMAHKSKAYGAGLIDGYSEQTSFYNTIYSSTGCILGSGAAFLGLMFWSIGASYSN